MKRIADHSCGRYFCKALHAWGANTAAGNSNGVDFSQIPSQIKRNAADIDWQRDC
jgi:hypothetical protein